jgi:hypothetical protein
LSCDTRAAGSHFNPATPEFVKAKALRELVAKSAANESRLREARDMLAEDCAHPMREDVKEKIFSPSLWKMRVW